MSTVAEYKERIVAYVLRDCAVGGGNGRRLSTIRMNVGGYDEEEPKFKEALHQLEQEGTIWYDDFMTHEPKIPFIYAVLTEVERRPE